MSRDVSLGGGEVVSPGAPPVKVDNWGIYLLERLHGFYSKGEHTDLVLRFASSEGPGRRISLHRLVFEASSDWLSQVQCEGGLVDMPEGLSPLAVLPVLNFMYTGKLVLKGASYEQIKVTAELLRMSVLIKLIDDAQRRSTSEGGGPSENTSSPKTINLQPLRQIRRIKRIQKKFEQKSNTGEEEKDASPHTPIPGKKLPIWKKRSIPLSSGEASFPKESHSGLEERPLVFTQVPTAMYGAKKPSSLVPSESSVTEILFDQVLETGPKKVVLSSNVAEPLEASKTPSEIDESMRELLEEQRKRLCLRAEDERSQMDEDDYGCGESIEIFSGVNEGEEVIETQAEEVTPKSGGEDSSLTPKVVRFNLAGSAKSQDTLFDSMASRPQTDNNNDLPGPSSQEPAGPSQNDTKATEAATTIKTDTVIKVFSESTDKKKVISEVLRKNPNLLKEYRQVKLKIITKGSEKPGVQYVTLRASDIQVNFLPPPVSKRLSSEKGMSAAKRVRMISSLNGEFRPSPKVMYTGRRGRPKQIKEGDADPHEEVRQEINQRLSENRFYGHQLLQVRPEPPSAQAPSSEAEAMSKVASDIAASINLVSPGFDEGGSHIMGFHADCQEFPPPPYKPKTSPKDIHLKDPRELDKVSALVLEWEEEDEMEEMSET